jgi:hypothetical protein
MFSFTSPSLVKRLESNQNVLKHSLEHWGEVWETSIRRLMDDVAIWRTDRAAKSANITKLALELEELGMKVCALLLLGHPHQSSLFALLTFYGDLLTYN